MPAGAELIAVVVAKGLDILDSMSDEEQEYVSRKAMEHYIELKELAIEYNLETVRMI